MRGGRELEISEGQDEGHCDRPSVGGSDWPGRDKLATDVVKVSGGLKGRFVFKKSTFAAVLTARLEVSEVDVGGHLGSYCNSEEKCW